MYYLLNNRRGYRMGEPVRRGEKGDGRIPARVQSSTVGLGYTHRGGKTYYIIPRLSYPSSSLQTKFPSFRCKNFKYTTIVDKANGSIISLPMPLTNFYEIFCAIIVLCKSNNLKNSHSH